MKLGIFLVALLTLYSVTANAQTNAAARITLVVEPTLSLSVMAEPVELITPLSTDVTASAVYHLASNSASVYLAALATVCAGPVEIPLNTARGVTIESGGLLGQEWQPYSIADGYGGLSGQRSEWGRYESGGDPVSTEVQVTAGWRPDLDQPPGIYTGWIVLYAIVEP